MIYVDRASVPIPAVLLTPRAEVERQRIAGLLATASEAHLAQLRINFDSGIWNQTKPELMQLFSGKCAYCESPISATSLGDIEHYRPKQQAEGLDGNKYLHHYAWLAYEWENLLIACQICNTRGKRNLFPVKGERARVLMNIDQCRATESPLLLDPTFDEPSKHLEFLQTGFCNPLSARGSTTISVLDLNRSPLVEARAAVWNSIERAFRSSPSDLARSLKPDQPYLATARASFRQQLEQAVPANRRLLTSLLADDPWFRLELQRADALAAPARYVSSAPRKPRPPKRYSGRLVLPPHANHRIRRVRIRNFKAIERLDFEFRQPLETSELDSGAMLLGENASGKSTVLEAITLALLGTKQIRNLQLRAEDYVRRDTTWNPVTKGAEIRIDFEGSREPVVLTIDRKRFRGSDKPATVLLAYGPRRFFIHTRGRHRDEAWMRVRTLFDPRAMITNPNSWLLQCPQSQFDASIRALRQLLNLRDEAFVARHRSGMTFEVEGMKAPLDRLSEGYKTIVATGVDIMREMLRYWPDLETARGVVLIDEIETHLHPRWKMRIVDRLRRAMPRVQFIATTHDPLCLRGMFDGEVHVLVRNEKYRIERLQNVPNVRALSVEQLLTSDCFGLFSTEDPNVEEQLIRYTALAAKRDRTPEEEDELARERTSMGRLMQPGATERDTVVYEAASRYLLERRTAPARRRRALKEKAIDDVLSIWRNAGAEGRE